jgi:hypothetical protein
LKSIDRWDGLTAAGAGLLGGGVWAQWGATWACMLWGLTLLVVALIHEVNDARGAARRTEG